MAIGSLGTVVFEASAEKVLTFNNLKRNGAARIASHGRQGGKELLEFLGPSAEGYSLAIRLSAYEGVNPSDEIESLRLMRDTGEAIPLIFDGVPQGEDLWLIENISEDHSLIDNLGRPAVISCTVSLKEYTATRE